ncbi:MAG: serine/threonine protein kinase [Phycisphaerales bacterium]|nr:MAG: serine/threonine protein kinase [Phycisphaerales bacterium]
MNHDRKEIEPVFNAALERKDRMERAAFLDGACAGDTELRERVEALLKAHEEAAGFLEPAGEDSEATVEVPHGDRPPSEASGSKIGRYKLLQLIGEGGFGSVYMAEQEEPVRRKVALKIIKLGMDTRQVIARFEAERQALALMDHPNIAKVLDAGATDTGRPYFVMELVKGISITEYCDKNKLATSDRLGLFLQVCHAVQHAHQKGIIHRDIKPNNVLVTLHDTRPVPKVIDFGIAKATSQRLTEKTLFTEFRQFMGTPEYMSPDQAEISGLDVDTRTDIYSLGVLLYELLTGTTPFDATTLRKAAYGEIQRIIREVDPPKPSTRVATLAAEGSGTAQHRHIEPAALSRLMRGDLDWIVMKALEKDRTRRYQTAAELADDVQRHLDSEPVAAGPPSVNYKLRKFVKRHRVGVAAGFLVVLALVVGLSLATLGLVQARREAVRSQRIADFLQDILVSTDPQQAVRYGIDVEDVVRTAREVFGEDHATVAATLRSHALQLQSAGNLEAAERLYEESLRIWRERFGEDDINVGATLNALGLLHLTKGAHRSAEQAFRESIRISRARTGETVVLSETLALLGTTLSNQGRFDEAIKMLKESVRIRRAVAPSQRLQIALTVNSLANLMVIAGKHEGMPQAVEDTVAAWRDAVPPDSSLLGRTLSEVGIYYLENMEIERSEKLLREALDIFHKTPDPSIPHHNLALSRLARILEQTGRFEEIIPFAQRGLDVAARVGGEQTMREARRRLANLCWDLAKKPERSAAAYQLALEAVKEFLEEQPDDYAMVNTLGVLQYRLGRYEAALSTLARSNAHYSAEHEGGVPTDIAFMAMAHHKLGNREEALAQLARLKAAMENPEQAAGEDNKALLAEALSLIEPSASTAERSE